MDPSPGVLHIGMLYSYARLMHTSSNKCLAALALTSTVPLQTNTCKMEAWTSSIPVLLRRGYNTACYVNMHIQLGTTTSNQAHATWYVQHGKPCLTQARNFRVRQLHEWWHAASRGLT